MKLLKHFTTVESQCLVVHHRGSVTKPFEFPVRHNDKNLKKLMDGEDIKKTDVRKIILVQIKVKLRPTKPFQLFSNIKREPSPSPTTSKG